MNDLGRISDEELTELALAAESVELGPSATPWPGPDGALMPEWYMGPIRGRAHGWRKAVVIGMVGWLALLTLAGICVTTGLISLG